MKSGFYYKFKDEPVGLEMLASSLTLALPKFIGDRIIMKKMKEYLLQVIDVQSGRVRYDFAAMETMTGRCLLLQRLALRSALMKDAQ